MSTNSSETFIEASVAFESLRNGEFNFAAALGELIDNSIEANATEVYVDVKYNDQILEIEQVSVLDNGYGMNQELVSTCLKLGKTNRTGIQSENKIGRFGVGLTLGSISIGRKVEVYSRFDSKTYYTYLDLDELKEKKMQHIPKAVESKSNNLTEEGTYIVISNCDRLNKNYTNISRKDYEKELEDLEFFLRRSYRKFLSKGIKIILNGIELELIDPLMMLNNKSINVENLEDYTGIEYEKTTKIVLEKSIRKKVIDMDMEDSINITMTLLPEIYRKEVGKGIKDAVESIDITQNEGVSILREGREVFYGKIPFLIGQRGTARYETIDRWWGLEIDFPSTLDNYFQVKYIKNRIEPEIHLRDEIREIIKQHVKDCRKEIRRIHKINSNSKAKSSKIESVQNAVNKEIISFQEVRDMVNSYLNDEIIEVDNIDIEEIREDVYINSGEIYNELKKNMIVIRKKELSSRKLFEYLKVDNKVIFYLNLKHKYIANVLNDFWIESENNELSYVNDNKIIEQIFLNIISVYKAVEEVIVDDDMKEQLYDKWSEVLEKDIKNLFFEEEDDDR